MVGFNLCYGSPRTALCNRTASPRCGLRVLVPYLKDLPGISAKL